MAFLAFLKSFRIKAALLFIAFCLLSPASSAAQEDRKLQLNEQTIKAGLVYNFLKYTTWPDHGQKGGRLTVCLFGANPEDSYLSPLQGQTAQQSTITLVRKNDAAGAAECSVLFIDSGARAALPGLLGSLRGKDILTVSDMSDFARMGGMVELAMQDKRVALFINKKAVDQSGLTIQSRLLNLAKQVSE